MMRGGVGKEEEEGGGSMAGGMDILDHGGMLELRVRSSGKDEK